MDPGGGYIDRPWGCRRPGRDPSPTGRSAWRLAVCGGGGIACGGAVPPALAAATAVGRTRDGRWPAGRAGSVAGRRAGGTVRGGLGSKRERTDGGRRARPAGGGAHGRYSTAGGVSAVDPAPTPWSPPLVAAGGSRGGQTGRPPSGGRRATTCPPCGSGRGCWGLLGDVHRRGVGELQSGMGRRRPPRRGYHVFRCGPCTLCVGRYGRRVGWRTAAGGRVKRPKANYATRPV